MTYPVKVCPKCGSKNCIKETSMVGGTGDYICQDCGHIAPSSDFNPSSDSKEKNLV